jgi:hypothetical protein
MPAMTKLLVVLLALSLAASCGRPDERAAPPIPSAAPDAASGAQAALDRLDARAAVPLLPMMANHQKQNMRDHLLVVQEIVLGVAVDDFDAVERAAHRAGYSEQMGQMCTHMGAGAPGFTEQALSFHRSADTIAEAAHRHDRDAVLRTLGATLQKCTGCHAAFKQSVVDDAAWTRLTATTPPAGHGP